MITREELYALVWSASGKTVAARLGISESYLSRVCTALDVPKPPRGWWEKQAAGSAPPPPPLVASKPGFPVSWSKAGQNSPPIAQFYRHIRRTGGPFVSPDCNTHPLVGRAARVFHKAGASPDGTHLTPRHLDAIDLTCSTEMLEKALALANALFMSFEDRGHPVRLARGHGFIRPVLYSWSQSPSHTGITPPILWAPKALTATIVSGVPIGLAIMEISDEVLMRYVGSGEFERASAVRSVDGITWTEWQSLPTRRLKVTAYSPHFPIPWKREWPETRRNTLVRSVNAIVTELENSARTLPHASFFLQGAKPA